MSANENSGRASATLVGLGAIVLWSLMVGLIRTVTESFGPTLGVALIYTLASLGLWLTHRPSSLRSFSAGYLLTAGGLFVFYEAAVGLSLGLASNSRQTIQISVVNYLWPTLTVLLSVILARGRGVSRQVVPGVVLGTGGIAWVVGGGLDPTQIAANVTSNPLPYALALAGASAWASYSVLLPRISNDEDGITLFVTAVAVALWGIWAAAGTPDGQRIALDPTGIVALVGAAVVIASGYACWNIGLLAGNSSLLVSASYATPLLSSVVAATLLGASLSPSFFAGVALVVLGSLLCWRATRGLEPVDRSPRRHVSLPPEGASITSCPEVELLRSSEAQGA